LKSAFQASLKEYNIHLRFFAGSWNDFYPHLTGGPYHLVLTSETIYRSDSLKPLIKLLRVACGCHPQSGDLSEFIEQKLSLHPNPPFSSTEPEPYLCLVAAKVLYFGVGGGISDFVRTIEGSPGQEIGKVETVWEKKTGVGRSVMRIRWNKAC